jgi:hypothetical protein
MTGLERQYLRQCVKALIGARRALLALDCATAVAGLRYGKSDTLTLDARPEQALIRSLCEGFDPYLQFVTEETGHHVRLKGKEDEVVFFSDPMDRTVILAKFLKGRTAQLDEVFADPATIPAWEKECGGPIELTGPYGSVTATRHHHILFNVMVNYITGRVYIACDGGCGVVDSADLFENGQRIQLKRTADLLAALTPVEFPGLVAHQGDAATRFVAYCQGEKYEGNLVASQVTQLPSMDAIRATNRLAFDEPGGPARILYLSSLGGGAVGYILSNGEKITEWLGWLAWVAHTSGHLRAYEISFDSSWTRDGVLMAPGEAYTVLGDDVRLRFGRRWKLVRLNVLKLGFLENPSQYRSTLVVCPTSNDVLCARLCDEHCTQLRFRA